MASTSGIGRNKRTQNQKKIFSPSDAAQTLPGHYLIYLSDTMSFSIVGRTSIKSIQGKTAALIVNKKKIVGEILFAGTFAVCQTKLNEIQQKSQSYEDNESIEINENGDDVENDRNTQIDNLFENTEYQDEAEEERISIFDEAEDDLFMIQNSSKKRKLPQSDSLGNEFRPAKRLNQERSNEIELDIQTEADGQAETTNKSQHLSNKDISLKSISNKLVDMNDNMVKMSRAMNQILSSSGKIISQNLDYYRDSNNQQSFSNKVPFKGQFLVDIVANDFGDFSRQIMRILFTKEELKTCILPPKRSHLARESLDPERFALLHEAVQMKYHLASHLYDQFYKLHLRPKLSDFLVEERRRKEKPNTQTYTNTTTPDEATQQPTNE